jgi:hypothetical protein
MACYHAKLMRSPERRAQLIAVEGLYTHLPSLYKTIQAESSCQTAHLATVHVHGKGHRTPASQRLDAYVAM